MKISLVLILALFSLSLQAQSPFAPVGAQWTYTQGSCCGPDSNIAVLQVLSDTVIDGRTCCQITASSGWFGCYELVRFFNVSSDSMYYFNEDDAQFHLLFRWNAVPGDTWSTPISQGGPTDTLDWTVSDTGHVVIGGVSLRTLTIGQDSRQGWLHCPLSGVIIEQLGGSTPFTWVSAVCDGETYNDLRCYDEYIYPLPEPPPPLPISWLNPRYPQCALSTGIQETGKEAAFTISPSPVVAGQPITMTLRSGANDAQVRIFDASGRDVFDRKVQGTGTFSLAQAGMYLVQVLDNGIPIITQRLIIQ